MRRINREHLLETNQGERGGRAEDVEVLLQRAQFLKDGDRRLLEAVFGRGITVSEVAHLRGECPQRLRWHVRVLIKHITGQKFVTAMRMLSYLDEDLAGVVRLHVLERRTIRAAARELGITLHEARKRLTVAEGLGRLPRAVGCKAERK